MSRRYRRRSSYRAKRPITKHLVSIDETPSTTQSSESMFTATFPCTIVGLRWALTASGNVSGVDVSLAWAIIRVPDGYTAKALLLSTGSDFYSPEREVMAFGRAHIGDIATAGMVSSKEWIGSTRTSRKLQTGDALLLIAVTDNASSIALDGVVQFFAKT